MKNVILIALLISLNSVGQQPNTNVAIHLPQQVEQYYVDIQDLNKVYMFKRSSEYYGRLKQYYASALSRLEAMPFSTFSTGDKVDYLLLKRNILKDKKDLEQDEFLYNQIKFTVPFAGKVIKAQAERRRGNYVKGEDAADAFHNIKNEVNIARTGVEKTAPLTAELSKKAGEVVDNLRAGVRHTYNFYNAYDPQYTWWTKKPYEELDTTLALYSTFIKARAAAEEKSKDDGTGIIGNPIGAKALVELLEYEMIPYSPEELVKIAHREFAWCDAEMLKASQQMGFGNDWKKALEKVKQNYVEPGKQPELVNKLAEEAIAFIEKYDMVTVPALAKEAWPMDMLTEVQQRLAPFFLGGERILIGYPTERMDHNSKVMSLRSNNYAFSHATVFHELIPGHNLQYYMRRRYKPYRAEFRTPFSIEGWSLYWEMLLWDRNFHDTPEKKIGALFWRMHRCARIIFSLNYHLGKWTPKQCIDFLVDRVGHEKFSAEGEVRRSFTGDYGPLYQIAYMLGGLQIRALYKEVVEQKLMSEKQFHDTFLQENTMPIEMVRAIFLKQDLDKDYRTKWRFAGNLN
jgi:hypothetical protein